MKKGDPQQPLVLIVDDDDGLRQSLAYLLESVALPCEVFADAAHFFGAYPHGLVDRCGCIVLDVRMPIKGGLEVQKKLMDSPNIAPIIIMTGHGDIPMAVNSLKNGALDFIEKPFKDQIFIDALHHAIGISQKKLTKKLKQSEILTRLEKLSPREYTVMTMVLRGKANKEIAFDLSISLKTVEVHRHAVMQKMSVKSVAELAHDVLLADSDILTHKN